MCLEWVCVHLSVSVIDLIFPECSVFVCVNVRVCVRVCLQTKLQVKLHSWCRVPVHTYLDNFIFPIPSFRHIPKLIKFWFLSEDCDRMLPAHCRLPGQANELNKAQKTYSGMFLGLHYFMKEHWNYQKLLL